MRNNIIFLVGEGKTAPEAEMCRHCPKAIQGQMPGFVVNEAGEIVPACAREALGRAGEWAVLRHFIPPITHYYKRLFKCWRHHWLVVDGLLAEEPGHLIYKCSHCQSLTTGVPRPAGGEFHPLICQVCERENDWAALGVTLGEQ